MNIHSKPPCQIPTKDAILSLIENNDGKFGKKEIALYFGLKDSQKDELKKKLKELKKQNLVFKGKGNRYYRLCETTPVSVSGVIIKIICKKEQSFLVETEFGNIVAYNKKYKDPLVKGEKVLMKLSKPRKNKSHLRTGKITKRLRDNGEHTPKTIIGLIEKEGNHYIISSISKKNRVRLPVYEPRLNGADAGDLVEANYVPKTEAKELGLPPRLIMCQVSKILRKGITEDAKFLGMIALREHNLPVEFPEEVIDEVKKLRTLKENKRTDLTHLDFLTIDPSDARDHDDAIYAMADDDAGNPKGFIVYIAIADVSYYVRTGSAIDHEAQKRGNSVYLPDRVVPMLPEILSNDLCSLKEGRVRPALVVKVKLNEFGEKLEHEFMRALIKCRANLSYEEVFRINENTAEPHLEGFKALLDPLFAAHRAVDIQANNRQPLDLDLPEYSIKVSDEGKVVDIHQKQRLFTHKLIEEFMIMANVCAAETLEEKKAKLVYRTHDAPPDEKVLTLKTTLAEMGIKISMGAMVRSKAFNKILEKTKNTPLNDLVSKMVLRCQCQAVYSPDNIGHFGLNLVRYAHFTSPIRRYADLMVHRSLIYALRFGKDGVNYAEDETLYDVSDYISKTERKAMQVEMETKDRYLAQYLEKQVGTVFHAIVSGVSGAGLFVKLPEYGAEGLIPIGSLSNFKKRFFVFQEKTQMLVDKRTGDYYVLGQNIKVKLLETTPITGNMRFELCDEKSILSPHRGDRDEKRKRTREKNKVKMK